MNTAFLLYLKWVCWVTMTTELWQEVFCTTRDSSDGVAKQYLVVISQCFTLSGQGGVFVKCVTLPLLLSFSRLHTFTPNTINACTHTHSPDMMIITAQNRLVTKNIRFLTALSLLHQWVKMGVVCCCPMEVHSPHLQVRNPLDDRMVSVKHGQLYPQDSEVRNCWCFLSKMFQSWALSYQLKAAEQVCWDVEKGLKMVSDDLLIQKCNRSVCHNHEWTLVTLCRQGEIFKGNEANRPALCSI